MRTDFFYGLLDWDFIRCLPFMMDSPHVQVNPTMTLLYKLILHFGWLLGTDGQSQHIGISSKDIYAECRGLHLASEDEQIDDPIISLVNLVSIVCLRLLSA